MDKVIAQPRYTCALGAQQTVLAIPGGIPIVHAGPGCSMKVYDATATAAGRQGEGYAGGNHVSCTNTSQSEVIFGGENKLSSVIEGSLKVIKGDIYVVLSGCTAGIIGDDVAQVAGKFAADGYPVVGVDTPGFHGSNYTGHEEVVDAIIDQYVGDAEPKVRKGLVNVFSVVPYQDPYWRGDLEQIKALLTGIGLEVNILFGTESKGVSEWKDIPNAEFNLLISPWVGKKNVEHLLEKFGTPFLHYPILPVGAKETSKFLRTVAQYAGIPQITVESFIRKEEKRYYSYFSAMADFIALYQNNLPYEVYVTGDSIGALSYAHYLEEELGFIPRGVYITDDPDIKAEEEVRKIYEDILPDYKEELLIEADGEITTADIREKLGNSNRALLLGTDWERSLARETGNLFKYTSVPINQDLIIQKTYTGYVGGLNLVEDIYGTLFQGKTVSANTYIKSLAAGE